MTNFNMLCLGLMILITVPVFAQETEDIVADERFYWSTHDVPEWDIRDDLLDRNRFKFFSIASGMYAVQSSRYQTNLYTYDDNNNVFHHQDLVHEGIGSFHLSGDLSPSFNPVFFEYGGNFYLLEYFLDGNNSAFTVYHTDNVENYSQNKWERDSWKPAEIENRIYRDACTIGDFVYLVYDSYINDNNDVSHVNGGKEIRIAKCTIDPQHKIVQHHLFELSGVMEELYYHPYDVSWFVHPDGNARILISYTAEENNDKENKGGGVIVFNPSDGTHLKLYHSSDYAFSIRAIHGSMQGGRSHPLGSAESANRIQVLFNHFENDIFGINDRGSFHYHTYAIDAKNNTYLYQGNGEILLHEKEYHPDEWNRMSMDLAYNLFVVDDPTIVSSKTSAETMYKQQLSMFYTDMDGHIRSCNFNSDTWRYIPDSYVHSFNLDSLDVRTGEPWNDDAWILLGICEGAPPVAIDWEKWDDSHCGQIDATEFYFEKSDENGISISSQNKSSAFIGFDVELGLLKADVKYTTTWETEKEHALIEVSSKKISLTLNESAQPYGAKFYLAPQIERLTYGVFPWWRDQQNEWNETNASSIQYRFVTLRYDLISQSIPLSDPLFSINSDSINTPNLWSWTQQNPDRLWLINNEQWAYTNMLMSWDGRNQGDDIYYEKIEDESITNTFENEIELSVAEGPEVFHINSGGAASMTNSTNITTNVSNKFYFSYGNLTEPKQGPLNAGIDTRVFLFFETPGFEYNDDLPFKKHIDRGQHPWYIGYLVTSVTEEVGIGNPTSTSNLENKELTIYPNPSDGQSFQIQIYGERQQNYMVKIFNVNGKLIYSGDIEQLNRDNSFFSVQLDTKLENGLYFITLHTMNNQNDHFWTGKLSVVH